MTGVLLDTHALAWSLLDDQALSRRAHAAIAQADRVLVCAASLYEIAFKVRRGQWPEMGPYIKTLETRIASDGALLVAMTGDMFQSAGLLDWQHRDPFDRFIAAAVQITGVALVSSDPAFDTVPGGLHRIW